MESLKKNMTDDTTARESTMTAAMTEAFPAEIWAMIAESAEPSALKSLSRSCKLLCYIARPMLYRNPPIQKSQELDSENMGWVDDQQSAEDIALAEEVAKRLGVECLSIEGRTDPGEFWLGLDILLQLLLCVLPNIRTLICVLHCHEPFPLLYAAAEVASGPLIPSLTTVRLAHGDTRFGASLWWAGRLLALTPNLQNLRPEWFISLELDSLTFPNIKDLQLNECVLETDNLKEFIARCPRLESFSYTSGDAIVSNDLDDAVTAAEVIEALLTARGTLQGLKLDVCLDGESRDEPMNSSERGPMFVDSLKGFANLESISLYPEILDLLSTDGRLLTRLLPPSVKDLSFMHGHWADDKDVFTRVCPDLLGLAEAVLAGQFRHLEDVSVPTDLRKPKEDPIHAQRCAIEETFKKSGVRVKWSHWGPRQNSMENLQGYGLVLW